MLFRATGQVKVVRQGHERALGPHAVSLGYTPFSLGVWQLPHGEDTESPGQEPGHQG